MDEEAKQFQVFFFPGISFTKLLFESVVQYADILSYS